MKKVELKKAFVRGRFLGVQSSIVRAAAPLVVAFSLVSAAAAAFWCLCWHRFLHTRA